MNGAFCLKDSSGWARFPIVSGGQRRISIGSLLHEDQGDSLFVLAQEIGIRRFVIHARKPYRGLSNVTLSAEGDLWIDDGSTLTIYGRTGGRVLGCRAPMNDIHVRGTIPK